MSEHLTLEQISQTISSREKLLNTIKPNISRKAFYLMEEKIQEEQKRLQEILDWQEGRNSELSKYSLPLNTYYFEQEFLN